MYDVQKTWPSAVATYWASNIKSSGGVFVCTAAALQLAKGVQVGLYWSLRNGACYLSFLISTLASRTANIIQPLFLRGLFQSCCNHPVIFLLLRMNYSMCICRGYHVNLNVASGPFRFACSSDASRRR